MRDRERVREEGGVGKEWEMKRWGREGVREGEGSRGREGASE